jgi:hypothetical protein
MPLKGPVSWKPASERRGLAETSHGASPCSGFAPTGNWSPGLPCLRGQPTHPAADEAKQEPYLLSSSKEGKAAAGGPVYPAARWGAAESGWEIGSPPPTGRRRSPGACTWEAPNGMERRADGAVGRPTVKRRGPREWRCGRRTRSAGKPRTGGRPTAGWLSQ